MPTYTTVPFLILLVLLWRWTRGNVLSIVAFTSIFDAASVLNFGALGVSPCLFALLVCLPLRIAQRRQRTVVSSGINRPVLYLVLAFFACEALSALVYPFLFSGIPVLHLTDTIPLHWGMPNLAQLCYAGAAAVVFILSITSTRDEISEALTWYVRGCIVATFFAFYQLANATLHIPFPDAILYSNTGHAVYHAYKINGMWRLNSTFNEASAMAGSLIGGLAILSWDLIKNQLSFSRACQFAFMLLAILLTLSTTGYLCLAVLATLGTLIFARHLFTTGGLSGIKFTVLFLLLAAATTVFFASSSVRGTASKVISSVVLDKKGTDSYKARQESHDFALNTLRDTSYLGAGLGSTRASGLAFTLLAGSGVPGFSLFVLAYLTLLSRLLLKSRFASQYDDGLLQRSILGLTLLLTGMFIAGTEPIQPALWMLFAAAMFGPQVEPIRVYLQTDSMRGPLQFGVPVRLSTSAMDDAVGRVPLARLL